MERPKCTIPYRCVELELYQSIRVSYGAELAVECSQDVEDTEHETSVEQPKDRQTNDGTNILLRTPVTCSGLTGHHKCKSENIHPR